MRAALATDRRPEGLRRAAVVAAEPLLEGSWPPPPAARSSLQWFKQHGVPVHAAVPGSRTTATTTACTAASSHATTTSAAPVSTARASSADSTPSDDRGSRRSCCSRAKTARTDLYIGPGRARSLPPKPFPRNGGRGGVPMNGTNTPTCCRCGVDYVTVFRAIRPFLRQATWRGATGVPAAVRTPRSAAMRKACGARRSAPS